MSSLTAYDTPQASNSVSALAVWLSVSLAWKPTVNASIAYVIYATVFSTTAPSVVLLSSDATPTSNPSTPVN